MKNIYKCAMRVGIFNIGTQVHVIYDCIVSWKRTFTTKYTLKVLPFNTILCQQQIGT